MVFLLLNFRLQKYNNFYNIQIPGQQFLKDKKIEVFSLNLKLIYILTSMKSPKLSFITNTNEVKR